MKEAIKAASKDEVEIDIVLDILKEHGMSEGEACAAVFDMQKKGIVFEMSPDMIDVIRTIG